MKTIPYYIPSPADQELIDLARRGIWAHKAKKNAKAADRRNVARPQEITEPVRRLSPL